MQYITLQNKTIIKSDYLGENIFNLLDKTFIIPKNFDFNIFEVTKEYIARPDLISLDAYGDSLYADIICKINGISNPFELNEGIKVILPTPDSIQLFNTIPEQSELENSQINKPVAKKKTEKRKANEAVIGDSRYRIDSATGVIIY